METNHPSWWLLLTKQFLLWDCARFPFYCPECPWLLPFSTVSVLFFFFIPILKPMILPCSSPKLHTVCFHHSQAINLLLHGFLRNKGWIIFLFLSLAHYMALGPGISHDSPTKLIYMLSEINIFKNKYQKIFSVFFSLY